MNVPNTRLQIRAISLTVSDADRSLLFYTEAFSGKLVSDITLEGSSYSQLQNIKPTEVRIVTLQLGQELIELIEYRDIQGKPIPEDSQSNDLWFQHLAIVVSDIDRAYEHLKSFAIEPISQGLQTLPSGIRAFKFKDLDRHDLEIIWFPPDKSEEKWQSDAELFLGIDHSAIAVADTKQSLKFYRDLLGMEEKESNINSGEIQALLDGLPKAEVRVTQVRPQQGVGIEFLDYIIPGTGRGFAPDWQSYDLVSVQIQLIVNDIELTINTLKQSEVAIVSPKIVRFSNPCPYREGCLVKDPDGHTVMLTTL